jgi:hypothetical protein
MERQMDLNVITEAMNEINAANTASAASAVSTEHTTEPHAALRLSAQSQMARPEATLEDALEQIVGRFGLADVLEAIKGLKTEQLEEAEDVLAELSRVEELFLTCAHAEETLSDAVDELVYAARQVQQDSTSPFDDGVAERVTEAQEDLRNAQAAIGSSNKLDRLVERLASMGIHWDDENQVEAHEDVVEQVRDLIKTLSK